MDGSATTPSTTPATASGTNPAPTASNGPSETPATPQDGPGSGPLDASGNAGSQTHDNGGTGGQADQLQSQTAAKPESDPGANPAANAPENSAGNKAAENKSAGQSDSQPAGKNPATAQDAAAWEALAKNWPADSGVDPSMLEDFKQAAQKAGINPGQAKDMVDWQLNAVAQFAQRQMRAGQKQLQEAWGPEADNNRRQALEVATMLDQKLGNNRFSNALKMHGIQNNADFVEGLYAIAQVMAEDSLGSQHAPAPGPNMDESPLDGIKAAYKALQRG